MSRQGLLRNSRSAGTGEYCVMNRTAMTQGGDVQRAWARVRASLRESAKIDGCGEFMIFWKIIVPLSTPILATVGLLNAISYWNDWQNGLYYMDDANRDSIQQVLRNMTNNISYLSNTSSLPSASRQIPGVTVRMAIAVLTMVPLMVAFPFFEQYFVKGISIGAVKE